MTTRDPTIAETTEKVRSGLREYIEAAYHVGNPQLVRQRSALLEKEGVLFRSPYIESTPRYVAGSRFADLAIPEQSKQLFAALSGAEGDAPPLLHDPPYRHQAEALDLTANGETSVAVTTGTGSGKTETFLLPILSKLAAEAATRPASFATPAVRALLLYPMNALVNDQLGRLRLLFGDPRVAGAFQGWSGRPARFARYTSRTLYPGVRSSKKDGDRLKPLRRFYLNLLEEGEAEGPEGERARFLIDSLKERGKWPAKPDLPGWYGQPNDRWQNSQGEFVRAILGDEDAEALTRHEVLEAPPDLLVTNYSMLEYMLMRPLERPIFDHTRQWLAENPDERLMLVVDEAHLYRGAAGAEVGLLLRRLRARLGIEPERLQVICTSASFADPEYACRFAAQLTGKKTEEFEVLVGNLDKRADAAEGDQTAAETLAGVAIDKFHAATADTDRREILAELFAFRGVDGGAGTVEEDLYEALREFPPMGHLINLTMDGATPVDDLGELLFPGVERALADAAASALVALGSFARRAPAEPSMLPCRVHSFLRGLPGLWACLDPSCEEAKDHRGSPVGAIFSQPEATCLCGARVFELFTCRNCGAAYARAYTDDIEEPSYLWPEPGAEIVAASGIVGELEPIDILLEAPTGVAQPADLDLVTGRLNPPQLGDRTRIVYLRSERGDGGASSNASAGQFVPCGVCGTRAGYGHSSVQDHQTKGDQPFQALLTEQIAVQPPGPEPASDFAPLRGRKVLVFSDSRQTAARLAPNLQHYSMQDTLRPVIIAGWEALRQAPMGGNLTLENLYLATLVGAHQLSVRIRPQLTGAESPRALRQVATAIEEGALEDPEMLVELREIDQPPRSLLKLIVATIGDRHYGFGALALASLRERKALGPKVLALPNIPGIADTDAEKMALARAWLGLWVDPGIWFKGMGIESMGTPGGVRAHSGNFESFNRWLGSTDGKNAFKKDWLDGLRQLFCDPLGGTDYRMSASNLSLDLGGEWRYCDHCRTPQRGLPSIDRCISCAKGPLRQLDPEGDESFGARKGYYRRPAAAILLGDDSSPTAIVAAEHTAQLNAAQADDVFSKAEEHELLFQDLEIHDPATPGVASAIDVLSCTTTMEVGIDIGALSGVALRNLPPSRSSYQQRAGRAGRRGNAIATVLAFGSADSHDEHYFEQPHAMIRGKVQDPVLTLDNVEIARRHLTAYLLQRYHQDRLPQIEPGDQPQLFEVLGTVDGFKGASQRLNRADFEDWLNENQDELAVDAAAWLPAELTPENSEDLLAGLVVETLRRIDAALEAEEDGLPSDSEESESETLIVDGPPQVEEEVDSPNRVAEKLLDRLLYKGVLPRYAFPTDVVAFHVFDRAASTRFRPQFEYSPSQGLPAALTQYAPGKEVWIDGKLWKSGAIYSVMREDREAAWENRRLYFECTICGYARTASAEEADRGQIDDCPACKTEDSFGEAKFWFRPPGFAHPTMEEEETSGEDQPAKSYATRAKLVAPGPADESSWKIASDRIRESSHRTPLLVTNTGPRREGYTYCLRCGLIEPTSQPESKVGRPHPKPYPGEKETTCPGVATKGMVLGTDFISDVLLVRMSVDDPVNLRPELLATKVALRTLAEAMTIVAARRLELEPGDLQAEHRPALSPGGGRGLEAEIYLYDTVAGGAGFAPRVGEMGLSLFEEMIQLLEECPADCDHSCYRCLRSFKNRFEHDLLDRHIGAGLLRYLVSDLVPTLSASREKFAIDVLCADLARLGRDDLQLSVRSEIEIPGVGEVTAPLLVSGANGKLIVNLHDPLTPDHIAPGPLHEATQFGGVPVLTIDELLVSRNLPAATKAVLDQIL